MNQPNEKSLLVRTLFSLFVGIVATGMSFYLILFVTLMAVAISNPSTPASAPALQNSLRYVLLPVSVFFGAFVFWMSMRRWGKIREQAAPEEPRDYRKTAA